MTPSPEMRERANLIASEIGERAVSFGSGLQSFKATIATDLIAQAMQQVHDDALKSALAVVNEQAEDDGLWFKAEYFTEDYLQRALRRLHAAVEGTKP